MNAAETLAAHALETPAAAIPGEARRMAAIFLHDSLCVGAAGRRAAYADTILQVARGWGEGGVAGVLGRPGVRLPAASAAYVNAFQIHGQEFDCVHEPAVLHPMATLLAAVMAEVERAGGASGADVLAAIVLGVDVSVALGIAATTPLKFFRPATSGIFGATAAVARLRGFHLATGLDAFGHALGIASGTMQAHQEGKPALPAQIAGAARGALVACDLAEAGLPGPARSIDGDFGYLPLFETGFDLARSLPDLGRRWRITETSWKPFPSGRASHGAIVATEALMREQGVTADNLDRLVYRAPPLIARLVGRRPFAGMGVAHARLCFPFLGAVTLTRGTVGLEDFGPERLGDAVLLALAERVFVEADDNPDPAAFTPAVAGATLKDGREARVAVDQQFGSPDWPLSEAQHLEKARACLAFAGLEHVHAPLWAAIQDVERLADVRPLFRLAQGDAP